MNKNIIIATLLIIIIALGLFVFYPFNNTENKQITNTTKHSAQKIKDNPFKDSNITFKIIDSKEKTWGYQIFVEGSMMINQPNKPGLPGNAGFKTQEQAQKVAELVISKIKKGQMPPTVTIDELKELGVTEFPSK